MPRLTEYLLKLATDANELDDYRAQRDNGSEALHDYLTASPGPSLSDEQADALASQDASRIQDAIQTECAAHAAIADVHSVTVTLYCQSTRIQTDLF